MKKREERVRFLDKVANLQDWTADVFGKFETQSFAHRHHESIELVRIVLNAEFGDIIEDAEKWAIRDERIALLKKIFMILSK